MRQKKGYTIIGVLGILIAIGLVVGVSIIVINRNRESQQVVEKREESLINRREQDRVERDINNNVDNGLLQDIETPKVESKIVDNIEPIVNKRYISRFRSLVNNKLAVNKPSIPSTPSIPLIPDQPSIPSIPNTPEIPVIPEIPTPPNPPTPPTPPQPPVLLAGQRDLSFDTGTEAPPYNGFNGVVSDILLQSDGKIIVGGYFTSYNGETANYIARLNADGSLDTTFVTGTGFNDGVHTLAIQNDGKIIAAGRFTSYQGQAVNRIARLNEDGSRDTSFNIGTGFNGGVYTILQQSDGKIIVGGDFTTYQGVGANKIARLNEDRSLDTTFYTDTGTGFNSDVLTLIKQADGKILVGGSFDAYKGEIVNRIVRLNNDGSRDTSFNIGTGFNSVVETILQQADGKIVVGGYYLDEYENGDRNGLARLNTDGTRDTSFDTSTSFNYEYPEIYTIAIQSDGKIVVGGYYLDEYENGDGNGLARLNTDGSRDTSFTTFQENEYSEIYDLEIQNDGKILVGGSFSDWYQGQPVAYLIRVGK